MINLGERSEPMQFLRKANLTGEHPKGIAGIGIHALRSDRWMTLIDIMYAHHEYYESFSDYIVPTWGELIRDLGLMICFDMVEVRPLG